MPERSSKRCGGVTHSPFYRAGLALGIVGFLLSITVSGWFTVVTLLGIALVFLAASRDDREHRSRGEVPHALWGLDDKFKPNWLKKAPHA